MLKIGLTGGIGSGKTTVARVFEVLGIPVYYADDAAKRLMNENEALKNSIQDQFGKDSYKNGKLNRDYLSQVVFNDEKKLDLLNSLVHPATIKDAEEWMKKQSSHYAIKEAALLFESGSNKYLDAVIGVNAPLKLRLQRSMERDNLTQEQVMARMNKQLDEVKKLSLCDYIITNDEQHPVIAQALALHTMFTKGIEI